MAAEKGRFSQLPLLFKISSFFVRGGSGGLAGQTRNFVLVGRPKL